jgi:hypothetical protein
MESICSSLTFSGERHDPSGILYESTIGAMIQQDSTEHCPYHSRSVSLGVDRMNEKISIVHSFR